MKTILNIKKFIFKMNHCAKWICGLFLVMAAITVNAQQEPTYTQFMFNTQTVNPAYAGTWGTTGFMALGREQWTGIKNAPSTQTFTFQTLYKEKVGLGLNVIMDKFGFEKRFSAFGDYSYLVKLNDELNLRMGLKFGFSSYSNNLEEYTIIDQNDPRFQGELQRNFMPNFGVGAFMYKDKYYLGLSVPKILQNNIDNNFNNFSTQAEIRHLFLMGGYVFSLSDNLQFKPTFLGKITAGAPAQFDLTTNFLIANRVWLGAMYRTGDAFGALAQWIISNKLRLGYSVDFTTSKLSGYQNGTHEVMVSYEISKIKDKVLATRYF